MHSASYIAETHSKAETIAHYIFKFLKLTVNISPHELPAFLPVTCT